MKKIAAFLICVMICVSICACTGEKTKPNASSSGVSHKEQTSSEAETLSEQSHSDNETSSNPKTQNSSNNNSSKKQNTTSKKPTNITSKKPTSTSSNKTTNNSSKTDAEQNTNTSPDISNSLSSILAASGLIEGKDFGYYTYSGSHISTVTYNDMSYSLCKNPNVIMVYDTEALKLVGTISLPAEGAEIQVDEDRILVSIPSLKCIKMYGRQSLEKSMRINLKNEPYAFCIDNSTLYYTSSQDRGYIYKKKIYGSDEQRIIDQKFSNPQIVLNKEKWLLYIGESGNNGCALYYYDTSYKKIVSSYKKNNFGTSNYKRTLFHVGDYVYWAGLKFDDEDAQMPVAEYLSNEYMSVYFADDQYITLNSSIYDINTCQLLLRFEGAGYITITESENLVVDFRYGGVSSTILVLLG